MAKIIINRKSEWMNRARSIGVYIDGKKAGLVKNGNSEEFIVAAGKHVIGCKIDWCGSNLYELELKDDDVKILKLQSGMKLMPAIMITVLLFFIGRILIRSSYTYVPASFEIAQFIVFIPFLLYLVYFLTIGRKRYLSLSKDESSIFS